MAGLITQCGSSVDFGMSPIGWEHWQWIDYLTKYHNSHTGRTPHLTGGGYYGAY